MSGIVESGLQPFVSPELDRIRKFSHTRAPKRCPSAMKNGPPGMRSPPDTVSPATSTRKTH